MRALLQRVDWARVSAGGRSCAEIGPGLLVFAACCRGDTAALARRLGERVARYRVFADGQGKTNRSVIDTGGSVLVVSQFTLAADTGRGLRPSFDPALPPAEAAALIAEFCGALRGLGLVVEEGAFRAEMVVELANHGPATYWLELAPGGGAGAVERA